MSQTPSADRNAKVAAGSAPELVRALSGVDATALVIGNVIGTGVFLKTAVMAQETGSPLLVLAAWVAAGLLSLAGALTYAELGAMLPHAGGEYVYLREAYGDTAAYYYGWMRFVAGSTGSIAILGVGAATFISAIVPLTTVWAESRFSLLGQTIHWRFGTLQVTAVAVIVAFTGLNCLSVAVGGRVQSVLTTIKIASIAGLALGIFFLSGTGSWAHLAAPAGTVASGGLPAFGAAMMAALWAYDGWSNMPMVAGEVRDPARNVPRALARGMLVVLALYGAANLAYFFALDLAGIAGARSTAHPDALPVAARAAETAFGTGGVRFIAVAFVISALGALNSSVLTGARVPYAMARDGVFPAAVAHLHPRTRVPVTALGVQAVWACVLAVSGTFDQLTDYVVFALWIFYALVASAVFVLRRKRPQAERPYRTLGYPVVPMLFVLVALWLVINTLVYRPVESLAGVILIGLGWPVRRFVARRLEPQSSPPR
ncbi:MAG TPA: amino acid permease [Opitutaceae bacterium]|nr:amino acid permease [Opitutaceae bacterium]